MEKLTKTEIIQQIKKLEKENESDKIELLKIKTERESLEREKGKPATRKEELKPDIISEKKSLDEILSPGGKKIELKPETPIVFNVPEKPEIIAKNNQETVITTHEEERIRELEKKLKRVEEIKEEEVVEENRSEVKEKREENKEELGPKLGELSTENSELDPTLEENTILTEEEKIQKSKEDIKKEKERTQGEQAEATGWQNSLKRENSENYLRTLDEISKEIEEIEDDRKQGEGPFYYYAFEKSANPILLEKYRNKNTGLLDLRNLNKKEMNHLNQKGWEGIFRYNIFGFIKKFDGDIRKFFSESPLREEGTLKLEYMTEGRYTILGPDGKIEGTNLIWEDADELYEKRTKETEKKIKKEFESLKSKNIMDQMGN